MPPPDPSGGAPGSKIALVNVKYSSNLGDGLIAECLEWALGQCLPGTRIVSVDLAGRTGFDPDSGSGRGQALALLDRVPKPARQLAISTILRILIEMRYKAVWRVQLKDCDHIVLGGGQLMADTDLNFPYKIGALAALARASSIPSAIFGVGVSKEWTARGAQIFRAAMAKLEPGYIAVRDRDSAANWSRHFSAASLPEVRLCRDPGLLAAAVYPAPPRPARQRPLVGLGVVHPLTLNLHTRGTHLSMPEALTLWISIAHALIAENLDVALFTNGPSDDEDFAEAIHQAAGGSAQGRIVRLPKPHQPAELVAIIAGCDAIAAHRLHANIAAFAHQVPHVGLGWDAKLPAFFASVGRNAYVIENVLKIPSQEIARRVIAAITDPVPEATHTSVIKDTWTGIRDCAAALGLPKVRESAPASSFHG